MERVTCEHVDLSQVKLLFTDIDDTISTDGRIDAEAYTALWRAYDAELRVVPVTGRPAGWCDHLARMWPVDGVIGENGGLYFRMCADGMQRVYAQDSLTRATNRKRLDAVLHDILAEVPGCAIASDQQYREFDLAIDFCEDVKALSAQDIIKIVDVFERHGATAKVSSIHVNGWFGDFDKLSMARRYVLEVDGAELENSLTNYAFIGDSPNDEPMFAFFPLSFGVANVRRFLENMKAHPRVICQGRCGAGFVETVNAILDAKG